MTDATKTPLELGKENGRIYETVVALHEASVAQVRSRLADPPSYSAVRATMNLLVEKNWLKLRKAGNKYLYRSSAHREKMRRSAVERLLATFFGGSPTDAVAALLDVSAGELTDGQLLEMARMIENARKENTR